MQQLSIEEMRKIAEGRGGKCLSEKYIAIADKLIWQCKDGHQWEATPNNVKRGTWCSVCVHMQRRCSIEEMQEIAEGRGGRCLSEQYTGIADKLTWQCKDGHQWEATSNSIKNGSWCSVCVHMQQRLSIEEMQQIAEERGGRCLSEQYTCNNTKLSWLCKDGHAWEATPSGVKQGNWCPACAARKKRTIEEMQKIAEERGGRCLSEKYTPATKLTWQCKERHQWEALPNNIKRGHWCPACADKARSRPAGRKETEVRT